MYNRVSSVLIAFCVFGLIGVSSVQGNDMLKIGSEAPDFTAKTIDGEDLTLAKSLAENPVILVFIRGFS